MFYCLLANIKRLNTFFVLHAILTLPIDELLFLIYHVIGYTPNFFLSGKIITIFYLYFFLRCIVSGSEGKSKKNEVDPKDIDTAEGQTTVSFFDKNFLFLFIKF